MARVVDRLSMGIIAAAGIVTATCANPLDLCVPQEATLGFFSKGDCVFTRASFFQGHEWLTYFGNVDLPPESRFSEEEVSAIAEGNRRVDWPKELLVHLNVSVVAYIDAIVTHTDRPENQRLHFLLDDENDSSEAAAAAHALVEELTLEAATNWVNHRERALAVIGQANHVVQDSFSHAHALREPGNVEAPWCVARVKAYLRRAPGAETYADGTDVLFHGGATDEEGNRLTDDGIGHTTTEDSIYREGRDCHDPSTPDAVEACLTEEARRARLATRDYLAVVREILRAGATGEDLRDLVRNEVRAYVRAHLAMCPDP